MTAPHREAHVGGTFSPPIAEVEVSDDGPGIPEELRRRLFSEITAANRTAGAGASFTFSRRRCPDAVREYHTHPSTRNDLS